MTSKFALVIANTEYQDASFAKLTAPGKDAEEFAHILREPEFAAFDDVQVLLNEEESKIRRSIARFFVNRKHDDLLLLYFSGHGVRNEQRQLFLAANDTEIGILDATGIPADFVTHAMNNSRSQRQLLILDCCNSGAFAHGSKSASGVGKSMGIATAFEGSGFGRVVLTATDATQYAWEGDKVIGDTQKSVFTNFLIEGLKGDADRDGDGRIHVDELYDYAYEQVVRRTPKQTPGKWSYKQQGDIILRENLKPRDVQPVPLPSDLFYYLEHPSSGVRSTGVQELIRLVDGKHLGLARAAEYKLREIAATDDSLSLRKTASDTLIARGITLDQVIEAPKENLSGVKPVPVEIPKQERREEKPALTTEGRVEGKIEKPLRTVSLQRGENKVSEKTPRTLPDWKSIASKSNLQLIVGIAGGLLIISLLIWGGSKLLQNLPTTTLEPTHTLQTNVTLASQPSTTITSQPSKTDTPAPTRTSIPQTQTAIPLTSELGIGSAVISEKDGMTLLYVPAGEFTMGSNYVGANEYPAHKVTLDAFWIDQTEVTNKMYALCVTAGACQPPKTSGSSTRSSYYGNSKYDDFPVIYVNWNMSKTYCSWAGRRLPTEAEWEKAARGDDVRDYPWGNRVPNESLVNYNNARGDTTEVGSYPSGVSPFGALDMAGNVSEWVSDWYASNFYWNSPTSNPLGPDQGSARVLRGGAWPAFCQNEYIFVQGCGDSPISPYSWRRKSDVPDAAYNFYGFRCAMSATP